MPNQGLYLQMKTFLQQAYQGQNQKVADHLLKTLAMMVTGVILGPHVQLYVPSPGGRALRNAKPKSNFSGVSATSALKTTPPGKFTLMTSDCSGALNSNAPEIKSKAITKRKNMRFLSGAPLNRINDNIAILSIAYFPQLS